MKSCLSVLVLVCLAAPLSHAATFTVTRTDDPTPGACAVSDCSLREAAIAANANTEADTIILGSGVYVLTIPPGANDEATGDIDLTADELVSIEGVNNLDTIIRAENGDRVFQVRAASFENLGITGGQAENGGGVLGNDIVDVDFNRVRVFNNSASRFGGGFWFSSSSPTAVSVTVTSTVISGNSANNGSALYCTGNLNCRFRFSDISNNTAVFQAAVNVQSLGSVSFEFSSINNNHSGSWPGGIYSLSRTSFSDTTISGNSTDSTLGGAGNFSGEDVFFSETTVSNNTSAGGTDGLYFRNNATVNFSDSIIDDECGFASGATTDIRQYSIETSDTCGLAGGIDVTVNASPASVALEPLADNGFYGLSHAIGENSIARGLVPDFRCSIFDQRRATRFQPSCDAGAYEAVPCSKPKLAIPDNNPTGITDELVINQDFLLDNLRVFVDIDHSYVGDLIVELEHVESGVTARIVDRPGGNGCSGNNLTVDFQDQYTDADVACRSASQEEAFPEQSYGATDPLRNFDNLNLQGTWRLTVSDNADVDTGTLNQWCFFDPGGLPLQIFSDRFEG